MDRINAGERMPEGVPQMKLDKLARHRGESFADSQKTAAEKVKHRLTTVVHKGDAAYPKVKYHPHKDHIVVLDAKDEAERAPAEAGWVDSIDEFPPSPVRVFSNEEKLAMFDEMAGILGVEEGQNPVEVLAMLKDEFNEFAKRLAAQQAPQQEPPKEDGKKKGK